MTAHSQKTYWQQQVNYKIDVALNDKEHSLDAYERIDYTNNSPDTLRFIWFHLWPNAYKNDRTAFADQTLRNGSTKFYFSADSMRGYINLLEFKVDDAIAVMEEHPQHIDIIKLLLPKPLAPNQTIRISTPFHVQLPYNFSRGGHIGNSYQITQWYPKPAVYDAKGWHEMPYLDQGEFYSEFGSFEVNITVPETYIVAATGELLDKAELEKLKALGKTTAMQQASYKHYEEKLKQKKIIATNATVKKPIKKVTVSTTSTSPTKTLHYKQEYIHDFAWFADKDFIVKYDTAHLTSKTVDVFSYYQPNKIAGWQQSTEYAKRGLHKYSKWIGDYPYNNVSVVSGASNENSGGMEYPTITLITTQSAGKELDETIVHEVGHNWFYGALASNERDHAWMDEAVNTYYQKRYAAEVYGEHTYAKEAFINKRVDEDEEALMIRSFINIQKDQPIDTLADAYSKLNYGLMVYGKGRLWMQALEKDLGREVLDKAMQTYYKQWQFKHPYPQDFKKAIETASNKSIDERFQQLTSSGSLNKSVDKKQTKFIGILSLKETDKYNYISLSPLAGYNFYDKLMLGMALHNYQLPLNRFQFYVAPVYAFGSKAFNYASRFSFNTYKKKSWLEISASVARYTIDDFKPDNAAKIYQSVQKLVPSIKLVLYDKDKRSTKRWILQARSFILQEDILDFKTIGGIDVVDKQPVHSTINQVKATVLDNRVLYPDSFNLTIDQGKNFIRAGFTGNYFFNYDKQSGGIEARIFAGKFFYTNSKTFITQSQTDRYHLNMSGPKGYEDYTYSNYFIGRNEFEGWLSQQIMQRDGFFKVRTDLLGNKVGKTDDWLFAMNFNGNLPNNINPLNALPFKLPLKFFIDVGTYADAWKDNASSARFLYDAGLQLPLFKSLVNIYFPLLYSKVYSNYFKSTLGENRFWKTVSFSIDVQKLQLNKISRDIPL
jgi:hypothetical protein